MWERIRANRRNAAILVVVMAALLFAVGYAVGEMLEPGMGLSGLFIAFIVWVIMTLVSYFQGDAIFLSMSGARKIRKSDHPVLFNVVEEMAIAAGLPKMPDVYVIDDAAMNAFATGRKPETAAVAVTAGLLERLNRDELQGVIAHELSHIKNRDVLYMMMVGVMMGAIVILADVGARWLWWGGGRRRTSSRDGGGQIQAVIMIVALLLVILAPIVAQFIYFAISRKREYLADACGASYTRYPEGLASALEKIGGLPIPLKSATRATAPMYIVNPLAVTKSGLSDLSSTHPPISERVRILRTMAGAGFQAYQEAARQVTGRPVGLIPASALAEPDPGIRGAARAEDARTHVERVRQVTGLLWQLNQYAVIACACGTKLKIPPVYKGREIECPHCGKRHRT